MRFPCCKKVFACHKCHDEEQDHHAEFASKIICGFCAAEQNFHDDPCQKCGTPLVVTTLVHLPYLFGIPASLALANDFCRVHHIGKEDKDKEI